MKRNLYCTYKVKREIFQVKHLKLEQNNFDIHNILKKVLWDGPQMPLHSTFRSENWTFLIYRPGSAVLKNWFYFPPFKKYQYSESGVKQ